MKKILLFLLLLMITNDCCKAQYTPQSEYINKPDINIDYVKKNMDFWINHAYDSIYGGFYSSIARDGSLKSVTQKSLITQTRQAYGFTRAFMLTGDEKYLVYAKSALNFLFAYGWDKTNDGWYCFANRDGTLDNTGLPWRTNYNTKYKWSFQQHYALVGIIANYEATHDSLIGMWMSKGTNSLNKHMWDARVGYEGYYDQTNLNWTSPTGKGFTPTVDAITTNAELGYLVSQDSTKKSKLLQLANIIVTRFIPTMDDSRVKILYPESFTTNWIVSNYNSDASIGHFIKTAWVLGRAYLCDTTKKEFKNAAIKILDKVWSYDYGNDVTIWDHINGGPFNNLNTGTGSYAATNGNNKDYWTLEQGFTGPMINYYITKNPIYLQMADEAISFYMAHFIDPIYGETFSQIDAVGITIENDTKGDDFKGNYHASEFGYYGYLYSNLYYLHKPASLYYKFDASTSPQKIKLTPIPMENGLLQIKSVTLDNVNFTNFDPENRTLNLAANQGGKFRVTFQSFEKPTSVDIVENTEINIYPNPSKGDFTIAGIDNAISLSVIDLTGKVILKNDIYNQSSIQFKIQSINPGLYLVVIIQNSGQRILKKVRFVGKN
ncbi:MAG: AGE family epimerase/isomerase [Bacteroidota bacterium]